MLFYWEYAKTHFIIYSFDKNFRHAIIAPSNAQYICEPHWEKYRFVMTILDPTGNYFHIDNKRIVLITIKQVITSAQIRYNFFYERANKLYDF